MKLRDRMLYVRFDHTRVAVRVVASTITWEDAPLLLIDRRVRKERWREVAYRVVLAIGQDVPSLLHDPRCPEDAVVVNPFSDGIPLISDAWAAETLLNYAITLVLGLDAKRWLDLIILFWRGSIIVHPLNLKTGAVADSDVAELRRIAKANSFRRTYIWTGAELTDDDIRMRKFEDQSQLSRW